VSQLKILIEKLSKSSPEAVNTLNFDSSLFEYLHVVTKVEEKYLETLESNLNKKCIIFLSGSSGDGKSAIINKYISKYSPNYDFHVDATHSFAPQQTSIQALDDSFDKYKNDDKSLVVGINIGIMINYLYDGSETHSDIKKAIQSFLQKQASNEEFHFINFEDYPKFEFSDKQIVVPFVQKILAKITVESESNPFYKAFITDVNADTVSIIHQNFKLLSKLEIQKSIIDLLILVHFKYEQFITARTLMDFVYILLKGPKLLVNQLFEETSNQIIQNIRKEDPILNRTYPLDKFILECSTNKYDEDLNQFINEFNSTCKEPMLSQSEPFTLLRMFFLLRNSVFSNNYHHKFQNCFYSESIHSFIELISNHFNNDSKPIKAFYKELKNAILLYVNKKFPSLVSKNLLMLSYMKGTIIATPIEIREDINKIKNFQYETLTSFPLFLKVNDQEINPLHVTFNMYQLLLSLNSGFRPNKHDRNTIVLFEELIQSILEIATKSKTLSIIKHTSQLDFKYIDDEIEVTKYDI